MLAQLLRRRSNQALFLAIFWAAACDDGLDGLHFSNEAGSGGDVGPAGPDLGGAGGRAGPDGLDGMVGGSDGGDDSGGGGDGGAGPHQIGLGGGGASGSSGLGGPAPPCVSELHDLSIPGGTLANYIAVAIHDPDTPTEELEITTASSDTAVVRNEDIVVEQTATSWWLHVTPQASKGDTTITLTVRDENELESSSSFVLTIEDAPILQGLFDMGSVKNVPLKFTVYVSDDSPALGDIDVTATSSNPTLLPNAGIAMVNDGYASRYFTLDFAADQLGITTVTVTANDDDPESDAASVSFDVTVVEAPVNGAELISQASESGPVADSSSDAPSLSSDGRYVAFASNASNLVAGDTGDPDVFVWDRDTKTVTRMSPGTGVSRAPAISGDGTTVAFQTDAQLVPEDNDAALDLYVVDLDSGTPELVSVGANDWAQPLYGRNMGGRPALSHDGNFVVFTTNAALKDEDNNNADDVYLRDRSSATTTRVSESTSGSEAEDLSGFAVSIDAAGTKVVFDSYAKNLIDDDFESDVDVDIFLHTVADGVTKRLSQNPRTLEHGNSDSSWPILSADGSVVVFDSTASNLTDGCDENGNRDVFAYVFGDTSDNDFIELVSVPSDEFPPGSLSSAPWVSGDGNHVVFQSNNVLPHRHVFVRDRSAGTTKLVDRSDSGHLPNNEGSYPVVNADGHLVAFTSSADNLALFDFNFTINLFVMPRP